MSLVCVDKIQHYLSISLKCYFYNCLMEKLSNLIFNIYEFEQNLSVKSTYYDTLLFTYIMKNCGICRGERAEPLPPPLCPYY